MALWRRVDSVGVNFQHVSSAGVAVHTLSGRGLDVILELLDDQEDSQLGNTQRDPSLIQDGPSLGSGRLFFTAA